MADGIQANKDTMEELDNLDTIRIALMTEVAQVLMETFESGKFQMIGPDDDGNERAYEFHFKRGEEGAVGQQNVGLN